MLFTSSVFIFQFLPVVLALFFVLRAYRTRLWLLLVSSIWFYAYWNFKYLGLLFASIAIDYFLAIWMEQATTQRRRKTLLWLSVTSNLGILFLFKYFNFFVGVAKSGTSALGMDVGVWATGHDWILPVGISFYTFQSMSYTIDIYRGRTKAHRDFVAFFTYVSFFPQLIAGPIIRYSDLLPQLESRTVLGRMDWRYIEQGIYFFVIGFAKKILLADRLGEAIDPALLRLDQLTGLEAWLCMIGYSLQLYFDFSGYSDMAVGLGKLFHLDFPQNFNSPYKAKSITDFWRRWHLSLSSWLRDYLYISLGGNRRGLLRTYFNLAVTMLLGGLWHGASWNFVIWGGLHGGLLAIERASKDVGIKISVPTSLARVYTYLLVCLAWVFFRAPDLPSALLWLQKLVSWQGFWGLPHFPGKVESRFLAALVIGLAIAFMGANSLERWKRRGFSNTEAVYLALYLIASIMYMRSESAFLYFQF